MCIPGYQELLNPELNFGNSAMSPRTEVLTIEHSLPS